MAGKFFTGFLAFMLAFLPSPAQDVPAMLRQKLSAYVEAVPWEELEVHTDRDAYIAGENVWFTARLFDRRTLKLTNHSSIAYIELVNPENRPVIQKRILLYGGTGAGEFILPDTLGSGDYTLMAYTSWMRNFDPVNCFIRKISVDNVMSDLPYRATAREMPAVAVNFHKEPLTVLLKDSVSAENIELFVVSGSSFRKRNENRIYMLAQSRGNIEFIKTLDLHEDTADVIISSAQLLPGISEIAFFDKQGKYSGGRYFYVPSGETVPNEISATDSTGRRDKIEIDVPAKEGNFSVSIAPAEESHRYGSLRERLLWGTEFGSAAPWGMDVQNPENSRIRELHSKWIDWENILSGNIPIPLFPVEHEFHYFRGKLYNTEGHKSLAGEKIWLCIPGKQAQFQYAEADSAGNFVFCLPPDMQLRDLIIKAAGEEPGLRVMAANSFAGKETGIFRTSPVSIKKMPYAEKPGINYQVSRLYSISNAGDWVEDVRKIEEPGRFYGKPDIELVLTDYIELPVMHEVFFELVPRVLSRERDERQDLLITNRINNQVYTTIPCLMIDGVIVQDASMILSLDPATVEKIDVVYDKYYVGGYIFQGIINVITKAGDFSAVTLPDNMVRIPYRSVDRVPAFILPDHGSDDREKSRLPDYRNTLYWNPSIGPDSPGHLKIECWTGDNPGKYVITIEGVDGEGNPVSAGKWVVVK